MDNFTVELKEPFFYLPLWTIIMIACFAIAGCLIIFALVKLHSPRKKKVPKIKPVPPPTLNAIKQKYLNELWTLRTQAVSEEIDMKKCYQKLSAYIRDFVYEALGFKVQYYTLAEIETYHIPVLTELISECYEPEFAESSMQDIIASLDKTASHINNWII